MKPEFMLLLWAVLLTVVQAVVAAQGAMLQVGLPALAGNREGLPEIRGWAGRAARAHRNMLENLVLFAALVLVAAAAGKTNATTLLGAQIFFWRAGGLRGRLHRRHSVAAHRRVGGVRGRPGDDLPATHLR